MNVYIDCGGWKGDTIEEYYNKNFLVIVFEPNSTYNCYYEPFNIVPINKAVWIYDGEIDFYIGTAYDGLGSTLFKDKITSNIRDVKPNKVPCIDFSKFILDNFKKDNRIILKMNVEGAEYLILNKMIKDGSIKYINKLIIAFHHHKITSITEDEHYDLLKKLKGIDMVIFGD